MNYSHLKGKNSRVGYPFIVLCGQAVEMFHLSKADSIFNIFLCGGGAGGGGGRSGIGKRVIVDFFPYILYLLEALTLQSDWSTWYSQSYHWNPTKVTGLYFHSLACMNYFSHHQEWADSNSVCILWSRSFSHFLYTCNCPLTVLLRSPYTILLMPACSNSCSPECLVFM